MIKAIALDDEPPALEILETFCKQVDLVELQQIFSKTSAAFQYIEKNPVDLLFLDINMPAISGIEFYKTLPQQVMVIFTTSYSEFAVESYNLNAVDYLLKPYTFARFSQALQKAQEKYRLLHPDNIAEKEQQLILKADYGLVKIDLPRVLFIEGLDNYLKIHMDDQKTIVVRITMKALLEKLSEKDFMRVHRSYIVPFSKITSVRNKIISIAGEEIPLGKSYEDSFFALFQP